MDPRSCTGLLAPSPSHADEHSSLVFCRESYDASSMHNGGELERTAIAAAEEVLRVIYGDDLNGCAVRLDDVARVIQAAFARTAQNGDDVAQLHTKGFEAVQLLSTPPADGQTLSPEDLRSLLSERLDKIRDLATKILAATQSGTPQDDPEEASL